MTLTAPPRLLLVHAHPDDETLWTGGTIARYAARGVQVIVVTCTLGEEGEIIPDGLRGLASDRADQLGGYRVGELRSACAALHVTDHRFLGGVGCWRDSGMVWAEPGRATALPGGHPRAFAVGDRATQVAELRQVLREFAPQVVVSYAADGGYGHPDHVRAHEITVAAAAEVAAVQRVFYSVPSRSAVTAGLRELRDAPDLPFALPEPHELAGVDDASVDSVLDVTEHLPAKISAMRAHGTQIQVWSDRGDNGAAIPAYALSNGIAQPITGAEHYALGAGDPEGCATDLFGGLGVLGTDPR